MTVKWSDHLERRLTLTHVGSCGGRPSYPEGCDQGAWCAEGCISFNDGDFHLPVGKLAEFVTTLYAAAGKPEPVILDRPPVAEEGESGVNIFTVSLETRLAGIGIRYHGASATAILAPGPARLLASVIAAYADEVEAASKPDPAEVQALALVLSDGTSPTDEDRVNACTVLRAGYRREGKP